MPSIIKYSPWSFLRDMQGELNQLFERNPVPGGEDLSFVETSQWTPHVDIKEEQDKFVILADLPGIEPKEIQVSMENNILTIKGERRLERKLKEENYSRMERFSGTFYRRFTLPEEADGQHIQAKGKHGVLEIIIPKKEPHVPRKIDVRVEE